MHFNRFPWIFPTLLLSFLCVLLPACDANNPVGAGSRTTPPTAITNSAHPAGALAPASSGGPAPQAASDSSVAAAVDTLKKAARFEDAKIGEGAETSVYATAFRAVLASPRASELFLTLAESDNPPSKLYGLSGVYLTAPNNFDALATRLLAQGGDVQTMAGCTVMSRSVKEVVALNSPSRVALSIGQSVEEWFAAHREGNCDISGGCIPLQLAGPGTRATRNSMPSK